MKFFCFLALLLSVFAAVALASPLEVLEQKCGPREFLDCPHCESTCKDPYVTFACPRFNCQHDEKCICSPPYVRDNGKCIKQSECPKNA
ncbi:hypothetical protein QR680_016209 [Steinernema hermaphroditum]|uniref:TIL domain-containing protein n=1 Tax=Steinernema hermaphroditum TaxID=289476 RepID=A0AA39HAG1_9BILA|nr:hypothetical protein QR680_016209 [Steinernema hermaphroditum]